MNLASLFHTHLVSTLNVSFESVVFIFIYFLLVFCFGVIGFLITSNDHVFAKRTPVLTMNRICDVARVH